MPYLKFLLKRAGTQSPGSICILAHREEWANHQLVDEMRAVWPAAEVALVKTWRPSGCDLLILPFDGDSPVAAPPLDASTPAKWVMFYGLERRRIWVFQKEPAMAFLAKARRLQTARKILGKTKLARPLKECLRLWKRFLSA
jgi:hypothetical protein